MLLKFFNYSKTLCRDRNWRTSGTLFRPHNHFILELLTLKISTFGSLLGSLDANTRSEGCFDMVSSLEPFSGNEGKRRTGS